MTRRQARMTSAVLATFVLLGGPAAFAGSWETAGFYSAKGKLIRPGMLMQEVLNDAGEPLERGAPGSHNPKKDGGRQGSSKQTKADHAGKSKVEVWTYHRPDGRYRLIFGAGRLTRIDVTPSRDM